MTAATLIPTGTTVEAETYSRLLKKVSLYSDLAIFVLPLALDGLDTSYSAPGLVRQSHSSTNALRQLVDLNRTYTDLVSAGRCIFLPSRLEFFYDSMSSGSRSTYLPPLIQVPGKSRYVPFSRRSLLTDPQNLPIYKHIVLPYFPEADLNTLQVLHDNETDAFVRFTHYLRQRVNGLAEASSEEHVADLMAEIEVQVADLAIEAERLSRSSILRGAHVASFAISLSALLSGSQTLTSVAGVVGSVTAINLLQEYAARRKEVADLRRSEFYIPLLLSEERTAIRS